MERKRKVKKSKNKRGKRNTTEIFNINKDETHESPPEFKKLLINESSRFKLCYFDNNRMINHILQDPFNNQKEINKRHWMLDSKTLSNNN